MIKNLTQTHIASPTATRQDLRIGVVGLWHGLAHVRAMLNTPGLQVVALCDLDAARLRDAQDVALLDDAACYRSYAHMLDHAQLDAVIIATPPALHEAMAIQALERDLHVLLEKPMAPDLDAGRRICAAAAGSRGILQIGFEMRSSPLVRKVDQIIRSGDLGEVVFLWTTLFRGLGNYNAWRQDRQSGGGQFFDCLVHGFDLLLHWAGADFERVSVFGAPRGATGPNPQANADTAAVCLEFANGVRASVGFSQISKTRNDMHFGIVGTTGRIDGDPWLPEGAGSLQVYTEGELYHGQIVVSGEQASQGHIGFREQYQRWLDTIHVGAPNVCDGASALRTTVLMQALNRSMATGAPVSRSEILQTQVCSPASEARPGA